MKSQVLINNYTGIVLFIFFNFSHNNYNIEYNDGGAHTLIVPDSMAGNFFSSICVDS